MKYDDLEFTYINDDNQIVNCNIISLIPKKENEFYAVFFDDTKDEDGNSVLKYGKIIKIEDEYELRSGIDSEELEYIKDKFNEDLVELANSIIQNN